MTNLLVITYPCPEEAERVMEAAMRLQSEYLLHLEDVVYVSRNQEGAIDIQFRENRALTLAMRGAFWGALIGRLVDVPWLGAGIGVAGGVLASRGNGKGIDPRFVHDVSAYLAPGSSALFLLVTRSTPDKVLPELGKFGGTVLHTSLSQEDEDRLQEALDAAHRKTVQVKRAGAGQE